MKPGDGTERLLRRIAGRRALARFALLFEEVWPALWPPLAVAGVFSVAALLDIFRVLPPWLHLLTLVLAAGAVLVLLARGLRGLTWPDDRRATLRLERTSGLTHRPLTAITDRPTSTDPDSLALWQAHVARATRRIAGLRVGWPRPGLAARDRHALRGGLAVALVAATVIAGPDAASRLRHAVAPELGASSSAPAIQIQAWITPPSYTSLPPSFLKPEGGALSAPSGSHLTLSITGATSPPSLTFDGSSESLRALDAASFQADRELQAGGHLVLRQNGRDMVSWNITVIADQPPIATWPEPPGPAPRGAQSRLPWQVADDYGVTALQTEIHLNGRAAASPLVLVLPLSGGAPTAARGTSLQDLSAHPWAGLPVTARLIARDALGQTGTSADAIFVLPERKFENPIARVLIAVRRQLSLTPEDRVGALGQLRGLLGAPAAFAGDFSGWLNLSAIASLIARDRTPGAVDAAQSRMWDLALHLEEGGAERTARALEAARQAARDALEQATRTPENPEARAELERKLAELQEAIRRHLESLVDQARREFSEVPPDLQRLDPREMDRLSREAQEAAREGRNSDVRDRLAELERMLEEMRNAQAGRGPNEQRNAERRQRGRQQMSVVQDMIGRQGQLLDHAQTRSGTPPDPRQGRSQPAPAPTEPDPNRGADQRVQQALRRALGELMQQFSDLTGTMPPALDEADQAMRDAIEALGQSSDSAAAQAEQRAIAALQRGGREMGRQMSRQFGPARQGEASEGEDGGDPNGNGYSLQDGQSDQDGPGQGTTPSRRRGADRRDPLGRQMGQGTSGIDESADVRVPEEMERQRTQGIQRELRRRGGDRSRPQEELDYIERLLRQF